MKKILSACILAIMFLILALKVNAQGELNWYIKRKGRDIPIFPKEAVEAESYDAYYIDKSGEKKIYLTFDAGYENGNVEKILDVLKEKSVPAAFFLLDNIILKNSDLVLRMEDEGHLVCNHTKNHKNLSFASEEEIARNLKALEMIYEERCGRKMSKYFRFPEGRYSLQALKTVQSLGYKTIFWSFAYDDWDNGRQPDCDKAIKKVLDNTHDGAVMLFHPTSSTNAKIFPILIDSWRDMGYTFGTLDELTDK
jgi:peptidoglycan-N-acetylmuramic acid deacetylase